MLSDRTDIAKSIEIHISSQNIHTENQIRINYFILVSIKRV